MWYVPQRNHISLSASPDLPASALRTAVAGWAVPSYDIRECHLDHSQSDATLFLKHNEYTIILRGHNLRQLYSLLLAAEVVEIPTSDPSAAQPADSYVTDIQILPNEDTTPSADSLPD